MLLVALLLSPFLMVPLAAWLPRRMPHRTALLAAWPALLAAFFATELGTAGTGPRVAEIPWMPSLGLALAFNADGLGLLFATLITGIGAAIVLYASRYLAGHPDAGRFHASLFGFMGAMLGVALSDNVLALFVFWELTGFTSFLLIGFDHDRASARAAALQALLVTGGGGLALLAAGVLLMHVSGTASLSAMLAGGSSIAGSAFYPAIAVLILLAAFTKSAQVPFHFWLPNAMEAPTPVSAYLHSATMVKAGVYLLARMTPIVGATPLWTTATVVAGAATMLLGSYRAVQETDLKRILAYSTLSALGVLTMLIGVGTIEAIVAAIVYLVAHAGYKGALFMVAGIVDHETGTRDISRLGGLRRAMPLTAIAGGTAALSMAGLPLTFGFIGKDGAYEALLHAAVWPYWLLALTVLASIGLGVAGFVAGLLPFHGRGAVPPDVHDPPWELWIPPMMLATFGVVAGLAPLLMNGIVAAAVASIAPAAGDVSLRLWHGLTPALLLSAVTLAGAGIGYVVHRVIAARGWKPAHGTEDLYHAALTSLDRVSRLIGPLLHSASLRTYVMAIVLTSVVVGGVALLTAPDRLLPAPRTAVAAHEALVVLVIVGGAIAAALAQTTMAAVLSLGAVGYGVAMIFLSYGAPDLAMTQFSVETLTVLIYVLVFRHFPSLGGLSASLVRYRDAVIALGIGTFIGAVVLIVSTMDTPPRLSEYFAEYGPTAGHGRNIVNVILVDFRGLDTLGEITVLATAAIGVRALLRLGAAESPGEGLVGVLTSSIFRPAARLLMPLLLMFSVFLLLRGHNQPGGGFVGGLVAAAAFSLYTIAFGVQRAREALLVRPMTLLGAGLLVALLSGMPAVLRGQPFLTAQWMLTPVALGTPAVFDVGVFLVVAGVVLMMIFTLSEES